MYDVPQDDEDNIAIQGKMRDSTSFQDENDTLVEVPLFQCRKWLGFH